MPLVRQDGPALRMLHAVILDHGKPLPEAWRIPGNPRGASLKAWREECERQALSDTLEATVKTFKRVLDELRLRGLIGIMEHRGAVIVWATRGDA